MPNRASITLPAILVGSLAALAIALVSQYGFDMQPCAWCVLQRLIFLGIAVVAALAMLVKWQPVRRGLAAVIVLLAGGGITSALYQHFVAARANSCRLSLAEKTISSLHLDTLLPSVFGIRASCAAAATRLLGIPYVFWSLTAFALLALVAVIAIVRRR